MNNDEIVSVYASWRMMYKNNYRKMHGKPMRRYVHMRRVVRKKLNKLWNIGNFQEWCKEANKYFV